MATNIDITFEIEQANDIIQNCIVLLADSYLMGYQGLVIEYSNILSIVRVAKDYLVYSNKVTVDHNDISKAIYVIREFLKYKDIKSTVNYFKLFDINVCEGEDSPQQVIPGGTTPSTPITPTVPDEPNIPDTGDDDTSNTKSAKIMDFREYTLPIVNDGDNQFTMPFNIMDVDAEYITMVVGGDNPKYTTTGVGFHMEGTTLYWHGDYPLRTNYIAVVKYVVGTI